MFCFVLAGKLARPFAAKPEQTLKRCPLVARRSRRYEHTTLRFFDSNSNNHPKYTAQETLTWAVSLKHNHTILDSQETYEY
jgi:hypothetical protein